MVFLISVSGSACMFSKRAQAIPSHDSKIRTIVQALEEYQFHTKSVPDTLEELVPEYIEKIDYPNRVVRVIYDSDTEAKSWQIAFVSDCGYTTTVYSSGITSLSFPPPSEALRC